MNEINAQITIELGPCVPKASEYKAIINVPQIDMPNGLSYNDIGDELERDIIALIKQYYCNVSGTETFVEFEDAPALSMKELIHLMEDACNDNCDMDGHNGCCSQ